jgi:hypothetical protein
MTSAANLTHLERDPRSDDLWCLAHDYHGALVKFDVATGVFTRYTTSAARSCGLDYGGRRRAIH